MMAIGLAAALACVVSAILSRWFASPASPLRIVDEPNERSLHQTPTPCTGGVAIMAGVVSAVCALALWNLSSAQPAAPLSPQLLAVVAVALVVSAFSFRDDRAPLSPALRFIVHIAAAVALVAPRIAQIPTLSFGAWWFDLGQLAVPVSIVAIVWMANLYNFMDGMDGFAGTMTLFGFGTMAVAALAVGDLGTGAIAAIVAASGAGFLTSNWPPARIFMGDAGSVPLGVLAAALALRAAERGVIPIETSVLAFSPFIADASVTLARRVLRGERVWIAHRSHFYQRLVLTGWTHRRTAVAGCVLMALSALSALVLLALDLRARTWLLAAWIAAYALLMIAVGRIERRVTTRNGLFQASASPR